MLSLIIFNYYSLLLIILIDILLLLFNYLELTLCMHSWPFYLELKLCMHSWLFPETSSKG